MWAGFQAFKFWNSKFWVYFDYSLQDRDQIIQMNRSLIIYHPGENHTTSKWSKHIFAISNTYIHLPNPNVKNKVHAQVPKMTKLQI